MPSAADPAPLVNLKIAAYSVTDTKIQSDQFSRVGKQICAINKKGLLPGFIIRDTGERERNSDRLFRPQR